MTTQYGFTLTRTQNIPEINARAQIFRHDKTGAELISVETADENKVFGITFRTPSNNSTGVAHILEHSVLCGSRKYPVKEPFVELLKGSLQTFLNAFTYPDKTCYPVASQNLQDFYNLVDVYLDAVFYPRLTRHTHEQEGWHYEIENTTDPLIFKGIVFNEMKGVYSSPDSVLVEYGQQSLFPDTPYGVDSGGHPAHIPDLSWEQLRDFHARHYHPSNSRIWFYGDDDPEQRLRLMNEWLKVFDRIPVDSAVPLQARFSAPRRVTKRYQAGTDETSKSFLTVNWLLSETTDTETTLGLGILHDILIGTSAAPLRKALIESGLGEDLAGAGLEGQLRQMYFSTGLKGIAEENAGKVEKLIDDTLSGLAKNGIDARTIEASLNTVEFQLRENNTGNFPRGLALMVRSLTTWLYEADPLAPIAFEAPLSAIKKRIAAAEKYFELLISAFLIQNQHRTTLLLKPDANVAKEEDAREKAVLAKVRAGLGAADIQRLIDDTCELKRLQVLPDPPEALAAIPCLKRSDLEKTNKKIPFEKASHSGTEMVYHELFTQGIAYIDVGFNLHTLPGELLPYVPLFSRALLETGTDKEDFVSLAQRIGSKTGGISPVPFTSMIRDAGTGTAWLFLRGKVMAPKTQELLDILSDILRGARLDNRERILQIVLEEKAQAEAGLIPTGHSVVATRLRSRFNEADWATEQIRGVDQLFFLRKLETEFDREWTRINANLEKIRKILISRSAMIINATVDRKSWSGIEPRVKTFIDQWSDAPSDVVKWEREGQPTVEGLALPSQVNYVGKGADLFRLGYKFHASAQVIARYLRTAWLWERVRVQGGAYGGFCSFDHRSGVFNFVSYRDPNLKTTLDVYDQTAAYLRKLHVSDDELTKSIIGAIGDLDQYQLPDAKGFSSLTRYLAGDTDEKRQRLRDEVLSTTESHFHGFADALDLIRANPTVVVLGSDEAMKAASIAPVVRVM